MPRRMKAHAERDEVGARRRRRIVGTLALLGMGAGLTPLTSEPSVASATPLPQTLEAWIYPSSLGQPACEVPTELSALAANPIAVLKPEYLTVNDRGRVAPEAATTLPCNGFSAANLAEVRAAAHRVYVTVSAGTRATKALLANSSRRMTAISGIANFVTTNGLDGLDLDFEPNRWSRSMWSEYMTFVSTLVGRMSPTERAVEVDLEPFVATPWDAQRYGDVASVGGHVVVMAYDHEFDVPCAPISPYGWLQQVVSYAQSQVPAADLTVGIPSYGYTTTSTCRRVAHVTSNVPYVTMQGEPGFPTTSAEVDALKDPNSGEIRWSSNGVFHDLVDAQALNDKLQVVEAMGVGDVSVWSLGAEPWFNGNPG
jgi:spore germination protein YaaH